MSRLPPLNLEKITVGRVFPLDHPLLLLPQLYPLHCAFTGGTGWTQPRVAWERGYITTSSWRIYDTLSRSTLKPHTHTHTHTHPSLYLPLQLGQGSVLLISMSAQLSPMPLCQDWDTADHQGFLSLPQGQHSWSRSRA